LNLAIRALTPFRFPRTHGNVRPLFITFEGTEGAGKSTLMRLLAERFQNDPHSRWTRQSVTITREPGGDPLAEKIRSILLHQSMDPMTELFLYEAARSEHLARVILPALKNKNIILCDRFTDSTLAYQGFARKLGWKTALEANRLAVGKLRPNLSVFLDIDPEVGLARVKDPNRFEEEGVEFQKKVRQGFLKALRVHPGRWLHLKVGQKTPEECCEIVWKRIQRL
jgi:dTMP kinase